MKLWLKIEDGSEVMQLKVSAEDEVVFEDNNLDIVGKQTDNESIDSEEETASEGEVVSESEGEENVL